MTDIGKYLAHYRGTLEKTIASVDLAKVKQAVEWFVEARRDDRQIFSCGNGGSALTASHMVTDVLKGASFERDKRFRVVPLTDSVGGYNTPTWNILIVSLPFVIAFTLSKKYLIP